MLQEKHESNPAPSGVGEVGVIEGEIMKIHIGDHENVNLCDGSPDNGASMILLTLQQKNADGIIQVGLGRRHEDASNSGRWRFIYTPTDHDDGEMDGWAGANDMFDVDPDIDYEFSIEKAQSSGGFPLWRVCADLPSDGQAALCINIARTWGNFTYGTYQRRPQRRHPLITSGGASRRRTPATSSGTEAG